jgi:hypothetical protein
VPLPEFLAAQRQLLRQAGLDDQPPMLGVHIGHLDVEHQALRRFAIGGRDRAMGEVEQRELELRRVGAAQAQVPLGLERHLEPEVLGVEVPRRRDVVRRDDRVEARQHVSSRVHIPWVCE